MALNTQQKGLYMLTDSGFVRKTYQELLENIITSLQDRFGADVDVSPVSTFGRIARSLAAIANEHEQELENVYNASFIAKAVGVSLDRLAGNYGVERVAATYATVELSFVGTPAFVIPVNSGYKTSDGYIFVLSENVTLDAHGKGKGFAYAQNTGAAYNVSSNSINIQVQPVSNVSSVNNTLASEGGADIETDTSLRDRILVAIKGINSATNDGIISAVRAVAGVKAARIVENKTGKTDQYGNPPYTIHIYVLGGAKSDVAKAIFRSVAFGISTYGTVIVGVNDISNNKHDVMFDYATEKPIFVDVKISKNDGFPSDGIDQVKAQIKKYIESLTMGETVRFSYLYKYIYDNVVGINVAEVKIGLSSGTEAFQDIKMDPFNVASFNADNVKVVVDNG